MKQFRDTVYLIGESGLILNTKTNAHVKSWVSESRNGFYRRVKLKVDGQWYNFRVHRLVAEVYLPNPLNKPEVHHIDAYTFNNHVSNLQWVTRIENEKCKNKAKVLNESTDELSNKGDNNEISSN